MAELGPRLRAIAESADPVSSEEARKLAGRRQQSAPRRRAAALAVAVSLVIVLALVAGTLILRSPSSNRSTVSSPTTGIDLSAGACTEIATAPIAPRSGSSAVWTGTEMIVWGGDDGRASREDGAAYDPRTDSWRTIAAAPLQPRSGQAATWTGTEMLVLGGNDRVGEFADGAAYDPKTDKWRPIAAAPTAVTNTVSVWTGTEWILAVERPSSFGRADASSPLAAYNPARDRWRTLPSPPDSGGYLAAGTWTGADALFVVQPGLPIPENAAVGFVRFNPATNRWNELNATIAGASEGSSGSLPRPDLVQLDNTTLAVSNANFPSLAIAPGDEVREIASPEAALMGTTIATGDVIVQWGSGLVNTYLPDEDRWIDAASRSTPADLVQGQQPVWTGKELLVWGGSVATGGVRPIDGGIAYRPTTADDAQVGCPLMQGLAQRAKEPVATPSHDRHTGWRTVTAGAPAVSVDLPASWVQIPTAAESRPRQVLVTGSEPITRLRRGTCELTDIPTGSAYVEITEHFGSGPYPNGRLDQGTWNGEVPNRPADFATAPPTTVFCVGESARGVGTGFGWTFRDQGRTFSASVFLGAGATEADRLRAVEVVDSLQVEPAAVLSPLDPEDEAAIRSVIERWLVQRGSSDATLVEDYSEIAESLANPGPIALPGGFTDFDLTDITYRVDSVGRVNRRTAEFVYSVLDASGKPIFDRRVGRAVEVGGRWLVSRETACAYLAVDAGATGCGP